MINLSKAQADIVHASIGQPIQVLASAGSGKTRVLTERVRYIIENTRKDGVVAITFTNKAAEEMLARLDDLEGVEDRCWISTVHAVAQRILSQYGQAIGLNSELHIYERDLDRKAVFLQAVYENGLDVEMFSDVSEEDTKNSKERIIQNYLEQFSIVKRELFDEEEVKGKYSNGEKIWQIFKIYQEALLRSGGIDFDDILVYAYKILIEQPWCGNIYRAKYKHICVDEAQDLNRAQYAFIKAFCGEQIKSVMMVGDPNQMIYGFNGSSSKYLCQQFIDEFSPVQFELKENYRSSKAVIRLANMLKPSSQIESSFALDGKSQIEELQDENSEAIWICNKIDELLRTKTDHEIEGAISLENMVVIARNRFVFQTLEKYLNERSVIYAFKMGERQVEPTSTLGKILDLGIRVRLNIKDWVDGRKLCNTLKISINEVDGKEGFLQKVADRARNSSIPFPEIQVTLLIAIQKLDLDQPNITKLCTDAKTLIEAFVNEHKQEDDEIERSLQELEDFRRCWIVQNRKGLGKSLSSFRNAMALGQLAEDYNTGGITLSTVHTMKGLEKDIVFLMGMCEGVFPDYRANTVQEIEEERNNAFVAVTRSRRWIYITYPKQRRMPWGTIKTQYPSRFVKQMLIGK